MLENIETMKSVLQEAREKQWINEQNFAVLENEYEAIVSALIGTERKSALSLFKEQKNDKKEDENKYKYDFDDF